MKRTLTAIALALTVSACGVTNRGDGHITAQMGVPILFGAHSSAVQVTPDLALTVRHGAPFVSQDDVVRVAEIRDAMLVRWSGGEPVEVGPRVVKGQRVIVRGTAIDGSATEYETTVMHPHIWACEQVVDFMPEHHKSEGVCTRRGKGYSYGFALPRGPITQGWSGGGVYDENGRLVGMIAQEGTTTKGHVIGWAYHADDLRAHLAW